MFLNSALDWLLKFVYRKIVADVVCFFLNLRAHTDTNTHTHTNNTHTHTHTHTKKKKKSLVSFYMADDVVFISTGRQSQSAEPIS